MAIKIFHAPLVLLSFIGCHSATTDETQSKEQVSAEDTDAIEGMEDADVPEADTGSNDESRGHGNSTHQDTGDSTGIDEDTPPTDDSESNEEDADSVREYPGTVRLYGAATVCEGTITLVVSADSHFESTGVCADESLGDFGVYNMDFTGLVLESGVATGDVTIESYVVSGSYPLTGSMGEAGLTLTWFVDDISIDGLFESE